MQFFIFLKNKFLKLLKFIFNKKFLKSLVCFLAVFFLIFSPNYVFNKKNYELNLNKYLGLENEQKIVLNLWHIETFEGGSNSRSKFIEKQAIKFNKQNNNCFVSVTKMTEEQLVLNLKQNNLPDMFSFGIGVGHIISSYLDELESNSLIRQDLIQYSTLNKNILAYPFILSGYCLISHENMLSNTSNQFDSSFANKTINKKEVKGLSITLSSVINPSQVLLKQNLINIKSSNILQATSTYNAYTNFIANKSVSLLGTARDVARCKNREKNGNLSSCSYNFLSGYSDLIQYVSVCKHLSKNEKTYAKEFAKFLTMQNSQKDLSNYGLFSTTNQSIYQNDYMKIFENALQKELTSISVFASLEEIENNKNDSFKKVFID